MSTYLATAKLSLQKYFADGKKDSIRSNFTEKWEKSGNDAIIWKAQKCLEYI